MKPWNPYAMTFHGQPIAGQTPPKLVVYGPPLTAQQGAMLQTAYNAFVGAARVSIVPNPTRQGRLLDGSPYTIECSQGVCTCTVWTSSTNNIPFDTEGHVFVGRAWNDGPVTMFTFTRRSGVLAYAVREFLPYSEDHPFMEDRRERTWRISPRGFGNPAYPNDPGPLFNANDVGRFGIRKYFAVDGRTIFHKNETLKELTSSGDHYFARNYPGIGYVAFYFDERKKIVQDDGTVVFEANNNEIITSVSFHPVVPRVVFIVRGKNDGYEFEHTIPDGRVEGISIDETNDAAVYSRVIQRTDYPSYNTVKKEVEWSAASGWVEKNSTTITPVLERSTSSYDATYVDHYLRTLYMVVGAVKYTKDVPFTSYRNSTLTYGGGKAELEAEYVHYFDHNDGPTFSVSGSSHTTSVGRERRVNFSGTREYHYFPDLFRSIDLQVDCSAKSNSWVNIDGERLYTLKSDTEWSMTTHVERAVRPGTMNPYADYGKHSGSAKLRTKCQRRSVLCYDPNTSFVCYIEEKEFEYQYQPSSSCAIMGIEKGEYTAPLHEDLLLGENELVPTGDPEYFLVMRLRGAEVLREKLQTRDTPEAVHSLRVDMIPVTSVYLRPDVPEFPSHSITKDEYKRRLRILLCTGYQFFTPEEVVSQTEHLATREHRFQMHPYQPGKRFDDYILTFGSFSEIPTLEAKYATDSTTLGGVLLLKSSGPFIFPSTAYVIDYNSVTKHPMQHDLFDAFST